MNQPKVISDCMKFRHFIYSAEADGSDLDAAVDHLRGCNDCRSQYEASKQRIVRSWEKVNRHARRRLTDQMGVHRTHCDICREFDNAKDTERAHRFFASIVSHVIAWAAICEGSDDAPYFDDGIIIYIRECEDMAHHFIKHRQVN